jgi:hypothetical protein
MIRPVWAIAGVGLLGAAVVAGAVIVTSSGGKEEVAQQAETATPTGGAAKDPKTTPTDSQSDARETPTVCGPNTSPAPGNTLFRWGDMTLQIPLDGTVRAVGEAANDYSGPTVGVNDDSGQGQTYVDATTGAIRTQHGSRLAQVDAVLLTMLVCPFDRSTAPWPNSGDPPAGPPKTVGKLRYVEPDPASGIWVGVGGVCNNPGGCEDLLMVQSAFSEVWLNPETGETSWAKIADRDREAFERYRASIQVEEAQ